jgi:hypothetical protein
LVQLDLAGKSARTLADYGVRQGIGYGSSRKSSVFFPLAISARGSVCGPYFAEMYSSRSGIRSPPTEASPETVAKVPLAGLSSWKGIHSPQKSGFLPGLASAFVEPGEAWENRASLPEPSTSMTLPPEPAPVPVELAVSEISSGEPLVVPHGLFGSKRMFAIVYNLVRLAMFEAAQRRQIDPDRVSFVDALGWPRWPGWFATNNSSSARAAGQARPASEKRGAENYRLMTKPRSDLMQVLATQALSPYLLAIRGWFSPAILRPLGGLARVDLYRVCYRASRTFPGAVRTTRSCPGFPSPQEPS